MLQALGSNDFEVAHTRVLETFFFKGKISAVVPIDTDPLPAAVKWRCNAEEDDSE